MAGGSQGRSKAIRAHGRGVHDGWNNYRVAWKFGSAGGQGGKGVRQEGVDGREDDDR